MAEGRLPPWEEAPDEELADGRARARILTELDRSLVVEAAAGAGKTHALVGRIVALVAEGRATIDQVAAVTFTRKAAGELRGRLLTRIESAVATLEEEGDPEPDARRRLGEALEGFEQAFAGTIHSFCARLLRERPVEAGVDPGFEELDPREEASLRREAWDRHLDRESEGPSASLSRLHDLGIDPEELYDTFTELAKYSEVAAPREEVPAPYLGPVVERVREFVEWGLARVPDEPVEDRHDGMQRTLFAARSFLRSRETSEASERAEFLALFDGGTGFTLKLWGDRDVGREVKDRFGELFEGRVGPALRAWREHCYPAVLDFLEPAVERYARLREERGMLDFQDLLLRTARMLRRHPPVRGHFAERYPYLLVDEFQDTDPIQAEIVFLLTGEERTEPDWRELTPRPGSLFLVGDPKQSIYRFRRADVDVYEFVRDRVVETGGEVVSLQTSFRSVGPLVAWLNESLQPILSAHGEDVQPPFVPLAPHRPAEGSGPAVRRLLHGKIPGNPQTPVAERDARRIARWVRAAVDGPPPEPLGGDPLRPGEVLVLLRQKKHLPLYARALEEEDLPYEVSGGDAVSGSVELDALLTMAEAVLRPDDPLALVAHLRGPLAGVSDDALYRFRRGGGVWDYAAYARRRREMPAIEEAEALDRAFADLDQAYEWLQSLPPAVALERLMSETGILVHAAGLEAGSSRAGSLYRVLSLVRGWQAAGREIARVLEELRALSEGDGPDVDEMVLEAGRGDAVRVMNLHKAKGLQGRVVFLADPLKKSDGSVDRHVERVGAEEPRGHFRVARRNRYGKPVDDVALPVGWEELEALEQRYLDAEEARLLYVAATRARDLLVVSHYPHSEVGPWTPFYDALEDVPELEVPSGHGGGGDGRPADGEARVPDREALAERRWRLAEPTYQLSQPSELADSEPGLGDVGPGTGEDPDAASAFGRVVHELARRLAGGGGTLSESRVARMLAEEGGGEGAARAALEALERIRGAWFWGELPAADRVLCEVPFGRWLPGGDLPSLERGVVDLAYRRRGGWVIVDYKTHRTEDESLLDTLTGRLRGQVAAYRRAWEALTGETVERAGLYFTEAGRWREVERS